MSIIPVEQNRTSFYAPLWTDNFPRYCKALSEDGRFSEIKKDDAPRYLLNYIVNIYNDNKLYRAFNLKHEFLPDMCMYKEKLGLEKAPVLDSIKLHIFSSGCAFAEFVIVYDGHTLEQIEDFSYRFKRAGKVDNDNGYTVKMLDVIAELFVKDKCADFNFSGTDFKRECRMFHQIFVETMPESEFLEYHLKHLARGYGTGFDMPHNDGDYDMVYAPYDHDCWAGSQEGVVNIFSHTGKKYTDDYVDNYKRCQLGSNYGFLYILLLNQRFTAIRLISDITTYDKCRRKQKEEINRRIVELKTIFAFNIVSDDMLYQNVYKRMYMLLDIDRLLEDIKDNEQQVEMIRNYESLETEKKTSSFLFGLSILSIFSVLIDAASYFDRIPVLCTVSTALSFGCMAVIVVTYIGWWIRYLKK